jgi:hypothetical protein
MDKKATSKVLRATKGLEGTSALAFPAIDVPPPPHKPKSLAYPSGNPVGTQLFPAFGDRLKGMIMAKAMPKKPPT